MRTARSSSRRGRGCLPAGGGLLLGGLPAGGCLVPGGSPCQGGASFPEGGLPAREVSLLGGCLLPRGCLLPGGCLPPRRGCLPAGGSPCQGGLLLGGCLLLGWCLPPGGLPAGGVPPSRGSPWWETPPLLTEWQTGVKILPCPKLRLRAVIKVSYSRGCSL